MANRDAKKIERIIKDFSLNINFEGSSIAIETEDITSLTNEQCDALQCGQSVLVNRNNVKTIYSITSKTNSELNLVSIYGTSCELHIVSYYHNAQEWYFGDRLITSLLASGIIPEIFDMETPTSIPNPMTAPIGTNFLMLIGDKQSRKIITVDVGMDEAYKACPFILHYSSPEGSAHDEAFLMYPTVTKSASLEITRPRWESYGLPDRKIVATWDPVGDGTLGCDILELEKPIAYTAGEGIQISEEHEISIDPTKVTKTVDLTENESITKEKFEKILNGALVNYIYNDGNKVTYSPTKTEKIMNNETLSKIIITCNSVFEPFQEATQSDHIYGKLVLTYDYVQNTGSFFQTLENYQKLMLLKRVGGFGDTLVCEQLNNIIPTHMKNDELLSYMKSIVFDYKNEIYTFIKMDSFNFYYHTLTSRQFQNGQTVFSYKAIRMNYQTSHNRWEGFETNGDNGTIPSTMANLELVSSEYGERLNHLNVYASSNGGAYFTDDITFINNEYFNALEGIKVKRWPATQGNPVTTNYTINNYNTIPATIFSAECIAKEMLDFDKASSINFEKLEYFSHHSYPTFKSNFAKGAFLNAGLSVGDKVCLTIAPQLDTSTGDPHFENLASLVKMTCECTNIEDETETWTISIFIYGTLTCTTTIEKNVNDTVTFPSLMNTLTYKEASEWTKVAEVNLPSIMDIYLDSEKYSNMLVIYHSAIEDYEFVRIADIDYVMKEIISDNSSSSSSSSGA